MDLASLTVEIRPRAGYESIDLGLRIARANARALWGAFTPVFLVLVLLACVVFADAPVAAAFVIWWFKPWVDRIALHVLSRAVFGEPPRVRDTLRALPAMFRHGALAAILHLRFDAARSLNLAAWQLEHLSGSAWRRRTRLLEASVRATAGWLTTCCIGFEIVVVTALVAGVLGLIPPPLAASLETWWWTVAASDAAVSWALLAAWCIAILAVEPFYVAGGFGLYLNRRTELESWDVEIAFRRMAARRRERAARAAA